MSKEQKHAASVQNQFIFESGSINTIIKDSTFNGPVYTCKPIEEEGEDVGGKTSASEEDGGEESHRLADEKVRQRIEALLPKFKSKRSWFSVVKVLMLRGYVLDGDFKAASTFLNKLFPDGLMVSYDASDLSKLHVGCLRKPLDEWTFEASTMKQRAIYDAYHSLALEFDHLLEVTKK